ncbi:MAG: ankyrin repeat domain-containing protein [Syntrophobacteraceae bacterium]
MEGLPQSGSPDPVAAVSKLIESGLDVNGRARENGFTILHFAALHGNADVVSLLLERGADPNAVDEEGCTALMIASEKGYLDVMCLLIDFGADLEAQGDDGSALTWAAMIGNADSVHLLLERGADPRAPDQTGRTALDRAKLERDSAWHHKYQAPGSGETGDSVTSECNVVGAYIRNT